MRFKIVFLLTVIATSIHGQKISKQLVYEDLTLNDGTTLSKSELENKVIVVNLWGTWCKPCIQEMPDLNDIRKKFEGNDDVLFLAIADPTLDTPEKIDRFLEKRSFVFTHLKPKKESIFFTLGGTVVFPTTLVYDKLGKLMKKFDDSLTEKQVGKLTELIEELNAL